VQLWSPPSCAHNDVVRAAPIFDPQQHHPRDDVVIPNSVVRARNDVAIPNSVLRAATTSCARATAS